MKKSLVTCFCIYLLSTACLGQVKLPRLISDGMVLQRNTELKIWGWASPHEQIAIAFNKNKYATKADAAGSWHVIIPPVNGPGPFDMKIEATNSIRIKDILVGEVWLCSGQSNMELTMERVKEKYSNIIANSANPNIRQFLVPDKFDFKQPQQDLESGTWVSAHPKNLLTFSAVAYFFAKEINERYHVPIGLINAALGGSPAEAWMSEDALVKFPELYHEAQRFKDDSLIREIETSDRKRNEAWYAALNTQDKGLSRWAEPALDHGDWKEMEIPGYWADGPAGNVNGAVWFRRKITVPKSMVGKPAKLWLGRIIDYDSVFINGKFVGATTYQYPPRKYDLRDDVLREGENLIAVRVINSGGRGGFVLDKPYYIVAGTDTLSVKGTWKYQVGAIVPALEGPTAIRWKPTGLYNKMIAPLLNYKIKGVIWYQGESNTRRPTEYRELFPALINNWRAKWNIGDFPFLYVQLANFMETSATPTDSQWAELRDAQRITLQKCTNTGMAVAIDLGEWNDIHPLDKQTVGNRLALIAQHLAYGRKKVVYSGPSFQSMKIVGNKIELTFSNIGGGLIAKGGDLTYFAIAGEDRNFVWAKAKIEGNKVIVWNDNVLKPVHVRYAWADNPQGANLYNREGLPASPFTTDK